MEIDSLGGVPLRIKPLSFTRTLRGRIVLLACGMAILASAAVGWLNYVHTGEMARDRAVERLSGETRLVSANLDAAFLDLRHDAEIISATPPVSALARAIQFGGVDPVDGSTQASLQGRMESVFTTILRARPIYTQIRFIGLADGGRELVRVDQQDGRIAPAPIDGLKRYGGEPFFLAGAGLSRDEVYFSDVSYYRENGLVAGDPTVRAVIPVFDADGERFGMIVINADYERLLARALGNIAPRHRTMVLNEQGDYLLYDAGAAGRLQYHAAPDYAAGPLSALIDAPTRTLIDVGDFAYYGVPASAASAESNLNLTVFSGQQRTSLFADAAGARRTSLLAALALVAAALGLTVFVARRLTRPLNDMTREVGRFSETQQDMSLPTRSGDEIGELARAFQNLTETLIDNRQALRAIVDGVIDGLVLYGPDGRIALHNPAFARIFGYSDADMEAACVQMLSAGAPAGLGEFADCDEEPREIAGLRKDGSEFPLEIAISRISVGGSASYCAILRDITYRKQMDIMKDEFVSTVNHELRTPLTSIYGSLRILRHKAAPSLDQKSGRLLQVAENNCERLTHLVNDILDLEKIASGKLDYRMEAVALCPLVADVVDRYGSIADQRGVRFETDLGAPDAHVLLDSARFNQALVNLLSNAAKFSSPGDAVRISVAAAGPGAVRVSVADNGPGIPESFRDKVFERFAQADSSSTRAAEGTGLGLNITKTLIEAFGGQVSFDTVLGAGTQFHFDLPLCAPDADQNRPAQAANAA